MRSPSSARSPTASALVCGPLARRNLPRHSRHCQRMAEPKGGAGHNACALVDRSRRHPLATRFEGPPSALFPMQVRDVMTKDPACVTPGATIREAAQLMQRENIGIVPVVEEKGSKRLLGVVTDRDIAIRVVAEGRDGGARVSEVMSSGQIKTCAPDDDVNDAMEVMANEQVRRVPIIDDRGA